MKLEDILLDRTVSSFPISISTARVLESIFESQIDPYDIEQVPDKKIHINQYRHHYYNIYTLLRNIIDALSTNNKDIVLKHNINEVLHKTLQKELYRITELYTNTKCKPILYIPDYTKYKDLPSLKEMNPTTKEYKKNLKIEEVVKYIKKNKNITDIETITLRDTTLPNTRNSLITTHYAVDLLTITDTCELLESHTGKLKDKTEYNTRYGKIKGFDRTILPFNSILLYTLGDNGNMIRGVDVGTKRAILRIAYEKKWLMYTREHQVRKDIKHILDDLKQKDNTWKRYL